jgi:hypothetical protein
VLAITLAVTVLSCGTCPPSLSVTSISPASTTAGGSQFLLTVSGNDVRYDSLVSWNGSFQVTTFVSSHELVATITATDIAQSGSVLVSVFNPPEGGTTFVSVGSGHRGIKRARGGRVPVPPLSLKSHQPNKWGKAATVGQRLE